MIGSPAETNEEEEREEYCWRDTVLLWRQGVYQKEKNILLFFSLLSPVFSHKATGWLFELSRRLLSKHACMHAAACTPQLSCVDLLTLFLSFLPLFDLVCFPCFSPLHSLSAPPSVLHRSFSFCFRSLFSSSHLLHIPQSVFSRIDFLLSPRFFSRTRLLSYILRSIPSFSSSRDILVPAQSEIRFPSSFLFYDTHLSLSKQVFLFLRNLSRRRLGVWFVFCFSTEALYLFFRS